jgi:hypothetical protein
MIAAAVHKNSAKPVTTGAAAPKWNSPIYDDWGEYEGNMFSDEALSARVADPDAYLDFYQYHWYPWQTQYMASPYTRTTAQYEVDDRPVIVGETEGNDICDEDICQTLTEMYENAYANGFDGVCGWKTPQNDGHGSFENIAAATNAFFDNHPALVNPETASIPISGVRLCPASASLGVGSTASFTATVIPSNATDKSVTWRSSDTNIATVSVSGVVTGVSAGNATITVATPDGGHTAASAVTVSASGTAPTPEPTPGTTKRVDLQSVVDNHAVKLTWTLHNITPRGQEVYRDIDPYPWGRGRILWTKNGREFVDKNVTPGTTYYYWVKTTEMDGTVTNSKAVSATVPTSAAPTTTTAAPTTTTTAPTTTTAAPTTTTAAPTTTTAAPTTTTAAPTTTATVPSTVDASNIAPLAAANTSYVSPHETLGAVNDNSNPSNSNDQSNGAYGNWNNPNSIQWVQYHWYKKYSLSSTEIYWFDDDGGVRVPSTAYIEYWDGSSWIEAGDVPLVKDAFNTLALDNIETRHLRVSMRHASQSTGILEWRVYGTPVDDKPEPTWVKMFDLGGNGKDSNPILRFMLKYIYGFLRSIGFEHTDPMTTNTAPAPEPNA